jgi:gas vesicle protein
LKEGKMKGFAKFVYGAIWGGTISAAVVVLLAPMSGKQFRKSIRDYIDYIIEEGERAADARRIELEKQYEEMRRVRYE